MKPDERVWNGSQTDTNTNGEFIKVVPASELERHKELLRVQCNRSQDLSALLDEVEKLLEGEHEGCNYLAYGHCNKCGTNTREMALKKIRAARGGK